MLRLVLIFIAILGLFLSRCGNTELDGDAIKGLLEGTPVAVSTEQVTLTEQQVACGAQTYLWDPPNGNIARLSQKGRDLKFTDDVRLNDPDIHQAFTQITGSFPVSVSDVSRVRDDGQGAKLADVRLGVVISHECLTAPLPLMGIRKGQFSPDAPVVFRFQGSGKEWSLDKLMH